VAGLDAVVWQQKFSVPPYYTFVVHTDAGDARFVVTNDTYWDDLERRR